MTGPLASSSGSADWEHRARSARSGCCLVFCLLVSSCVFNHIAVVGHWFARLPLHPEDWDPFVLMPQAKDRAKSTFELRQIGMAIQNHASSNNERLPAGGTFDSRCRGLHGWPTQLLPYLSIQTSDIDFDTSWNQGQNVEHYRKRISMFQCEDIDAAYDADGFALTHFSANGRVMGGERQRSLAEIPDMSATLLIGEAAGRYVPRGWPWNWRDPALGINRFQDGFGSSNRRGAMCCFVDGSVRYVTEAAAPATLGPTDEDEILLRTPP